MAFMCMNVTMTLVDNGSVIIVCSLQTARRLAFKDADVDFNPSHQSIRAYDNSRHQSLGSIALNISAMATMTS